MSYSMPTQYSIRENLVDRILEQGQKLRNAMVESILKNDPFNTDVVNQDNLKTKSFTSLELTPRNKLLRSSTSRTDLSEFGKVCNAESASTARTVKPNNSCLFHVDAKVVHKKVAPSKVANRKKRVVTPIKNASSQTEEFSDGERRKIRPKGATLVKKAAPAVHKPSLQDSTTQTEELSDKDREKISTFLRGDAMCKFEEDKALDTLRSMSPRNLCRVADEVFTSSGVCCCDICKKYNQDIPECDIKRTHDKCRGEESDKSPISDQLKSTYHSQNNSFLSFVDSLRVAVFRLSLNEFGNKKVFSGLNEDRKTPCDSQTFFVEYQIPEMLRKSPENAKSKVNANDPVRFCSRRMYTEDIVFKQVYVHNIANLRIINLEDVSLYFQISFRSLKQKSAFHLGYAQFNFIDLLASKNLTCTRDLLIRLKVDTPLVVGKLRVTFQFGCGRLYFGKEFVDAVNSNQHDTTLTVEDEDANLKSRNEKACLPHVVWPNNKSKLNSPKQISVDKSRTPRKEPVVTLKVDAQEKQLLFGFLYVREACFADRQITSYFTCKPFCQDNTCSSKIIANSVNPIFNFCQRVPLLYNDELLAQLRENYMLIEFWEKFGIRDVILGVAKLSLHQFYLAYRNADILKYLCKNQFPVIANDWWESIVDPYTNDLVGQAQVLLALGTEAQIANLETERGFKKNIVRANVFLPLKKPSSMVKSTEESTPRVVSVEQDKPVKLRKEPKTSDAAVQSDMEVKETKKSPTQEMLTSFLSQLSNQCRRQPVTDSSTNTENPPSEQNANASGVELKKTSDLLDSLQKALHLDSRNTPTPKSRNDDTFRAFVVIKEALHLPSRKKCKSKKSRTKSGRTDDNILPSTYVTFETTPGEELKATPIVPKSINPKWEYKCEVALPTEFLINTQKRLIFKVWRKATNTTMVPNMQTDVVLGFAALDLTVLLSGLPNVQGWFNIVDFSSKCNGQINIHLNPLEDLSVFNNQKDGSPSFSPVTVTSTFSETTPDEPCELLSRALKRKFTELDEITQRLRLRLSEVNNEESDCSNDEVADEFERDINTLCIEEDFDMVDFETDVKGQKDNKFKSLLTVDVDVESKPSSTDSSNVNLSGLSLSLSDNSKAEERIQQHPATLSALDRQLVEEKLHIDTLLGKLSLLSNDRYVSGCSLSNENSRSAIDTEAILKDLDSGSRPNIMASSRFDPLLFQQLYGGSMTGKSSDKSNFDSLEATSSSTSLLVSSVSDCRAAPDGQGTLSDDKINNVSNKK